MKQLSESQTVIKIEKGRNFVLLRRQDTVEIAAKMVPKAYAWGNHKGQTYIFFRR